jgi:transposase
VLLSLLYQSIRALFSLLTVIVRSDLSTKVELLVRCWSPHPRSCAKNSPAWAAPNSSRRALACNLLVIWPTRTRAPGTRCALRRLAGRWHELNAEITDLDTQLAALVTRARPDLPAIKGVGVETAAQLLSTCGDNPDRLYSEAAFASLRGVSPVPASSGKTTRHRLNSGGDRQANRALYIIAVSRMAHDARTRAYVQRRTGTGLSKKEIIRCLKRYIARELYKVLTSPKTQTTQAKDLTKAA